MQDRNQGTLGVRTLEELRARSLEMVSNDHKAAFLDFSADLKSY
jgi:hypothetical protein